MRTKTGININCEICKKDFYIYKHKIGVKKCCSKKCGYIYLSNIKKGKCPKNIELIRFWNKTPDVKCNCIQCKKDFILTESQLKLKTYSGKFCSHQCYGKSMIGKRPRHLINYNHNLKTKNKISKKSIEMWANPEIKKKLKENWIKKLKFSDEDIIEQYVNNEKSMKDICKVFHTSRETIKDILIRNKVDYIKISRKRIGENTKKHRPFQIIPKEDTSIEVKIQNFLKTLRIEFFTHNYMKINHHYLCDIFIPSMNLVIECDGDYWHKYPTGRDIDHIRTKELIEKGFKVLRLWEFEIKAMNINDFNRRLQNE